MRAIAADLGDGRTTAGSTAGPGAEKWCEKASRQQTAQTAACVHIWDKCKTKSPLYVRGFCRSCRLPRRRRESAGFGVWFCRLCCRGDAVGFLAWNSADTRRASSLPPILAPPVSGRVTRIDDHQVGRPVGISTAWPDVERVPTDTRFFRGYCHGWENDVRS